MGQLRPKVHAPLTTGGYFKANCPKFKETQRIFPSIRQPKPLLARAQTDLGRRRA
jgi:hypothetical protein